MRRIVKSLLLALPALVLAGAASAYVISALETSSGPYGPSDTLIVDIWLDTEGVELYGFAMYVDFDPAVLSPDPAASVRHPLPGEDPIYIQMYIYYPVWYIAGQASGGAMPPVNQSIATLVFHVIDLPGSTLIEPSFDWGPWGHFVVKEGGLPVDVTGQVELNALHIPEPTTTMLLGLGLFGMLYASRRR